MTKKMFLLIGIFIIAVPIVLIICITYLEMKKYEPRPDYTIGEITYGEPVAVERTTIEEKFVLQGRFTADKFKFVDFSLGYGDQVKVVVSADVEVKKGDLLGLINAKPFYSTTNGLIQEISVGSESGYFKVLDLDSLIFECYVDPETELTPGQVYTANDTIKLRLAFLSNVVDEAGRKARFEVEGGNYLYGQSAVFEVSTGVFHKDVLATRKEAVYRKEVGGPYFIRRVEINGRVIGEVEVKVGISDNKMISITGAEEGWYCDSGYGALMRARLEDGA